MIFVILGTQKFQLNRLLQQIDRYVDSGEIQDEVIAQIGHSSYLPQHFTYHRFLDKEAFTAYIRNADLIVTHSGVGSIITAKQYQKPVIVFPRMAKYGEHVDDHQMEIANAFAVKEYVLKCSEEDDLLEIIGISKNCRLKPYISQTSRIVNLIGAFIDEACI